MGEVGIFVGGRRGSAVTRAERWLEVGRFLSYGMGSLCGGEGEPYFHFSRGAVVPGVIGD